jgi:hypothetical protein
VLALVRLGFLVSVAFACASCAPAIPPSTRVVTDTLRASEREATITFYWPVGSCDASGHYALAHDREGLIAKVGRATRVIEIVEPGEHVFWVWNPSRERIMEARSPTDVALTRIVTEPGGQYFVRLAFGEWDDRGPRTVVTQTRGRLGAIAQRCVGSNVALIAIGPDDPSLAGAAKEAAALPVLELDTSVPHDERDVREHRSLAEARFERLGEEGRDLAVVEARDGAEQAKAAPAP